MVSRRNYLTIAVMMFLVLFMFQFTGVAKDVLNEYETNEYADSTATGFTEADAFVPTAGSDVTGIDSDREYVVYIGTPEDEIGNVVTWWCTYSKREIVYYPSLAECSFPKEHLPLAVILDGTRMTDLSGDSRILLSFADAGINLIFARLPQPEQIMECDTLQHEILGIFNVMDTEVTLTGMHLFEGFLLGGEAIYEEKDEEESRQDLNLTVPWYMTDFGTKTYLVGMLEDETVKNESLPAIIWRSRCQNAYTFCVNGDYLCHVEGMGLLSAMMAEGKDYDLYPVVNAQSLVIANYPGFAEENGEELQKRYSQSQRALFQEIIWPVLVSVESRISMKLSCMMTPQFDYVDNREPESGVEYYLKLLHEVHGEAGISLDTVSPTSLEEKLERDLSFWEQEAENYAFQAVYTADEEKLAGIFSSPKLSEIHTVVQKQGSGREPMISYGTNSVTLQRATNDGENYTYTDDLMNKSVETALGYANIVVDFTKVAYPQEAEDSWEKLSKKITSTVCTYWKPFSDFSGTTVSESDQRIRRFLALDYTETGSEEGIAIEIRNFEGQAWFILRTSGQEISGITGGSYTEIEKNAYLIEAEESRLTVNWKPEPLHKLFIYQEDGE
ncbi:MAG: DUF2194 domain-containing protein [Roseburia sp.]